MIFSRNFTTILELSQILIQQMIHDCSSLFNFRGLQEKLHEDIHH